MKIDVYNVFIKIMISIMEEFECMVISITTML